MKLPRPYVPLDVRLTVVRRQLAKAGIIPKHIDYGLTSLERLTLLLDLLFGTIHIQCDHDPALCNREFNKRTGKYKPDANDPDFLIYRKADDHKIKTFIRGDGAQRSDVSQRRYLNRVAANKKPKKKFKPRRAKHIRRVIHASIPVRND